MSCPYFGNTGTFNTYYICKSGRYPGERMGNGNCINRTNYNDYIKTNCATIQFKNCEFYPKQNSQILNKCCDKMPRTARFCDTCGTKLP